MTSCENTVEQVLQRRGSITLYRQVADDISAKFRRLYQPGDQLPSEMDLTKEYGVSRTTVRRALEYLENRELIVRKQGKGIFVNISRIHQDLLQLDGFYPSLLKHGVDPLTRLQRFEIVEATPKVQAALRTGDDRVLLLERYSTLVLVSD